MPYRDSLPRIYSLSLAGLILAAIAACAHLGEVQGYIASAILLAVLVAMTASFSVDTLRRFPRPHMLPFVWASLLLVEFVVSPTIDIFSGSFSAATEHSAASFERALVASILFVAGTWAGLRLATRGFTGRASDRHGSPTLALHPHRLLAPTLLFATTVGVAAAAFVLLTSGALAGDLRSARGEGLIGTTVFLPLVRLIDLSTLISSRVSVSAPSARTRRAFLAISLLSLLCASALPLALHQRFGVAQALAYFLLPRLASRTEGGRARNRLLAVLPLALVAAFFANAATALLREVVVTGGNPDSTGTLTRRIADGEGGSHFRHLLLLSTLIDKEAGLEAYGGPYDGLPFVGDLLIVLPRVLFPNKPLTTMEAVNSVALGRPFTALDRGSASIYTSSLWVQLYLLGGLWGMFPLAAVFAFFAWRAWHAASRSETLPATIIAAVLWVQTGWLAYNVAFTTVELPGMLLGVLLVWFLPCRLSQAVRLAPGGTSAASNHNVR